MGKGIEFQMLWCRHAEGAFTEWMFLWLVEQGGICQMTSANVEEHRVL